LIPTNMDMRGGGWQPNLWSVVAEMAHGQDRSRASMRK